MTPAPERLPPNASDYTRLAARLAAHGIGDAWIGGQPRFSASPAVLSRPQAVSLAGAAERVAAVLDELCRIVAREPALLSDFFQLTPVQRLLFQTSAPFWHVHARADVFLRPDGGAVVCELNCDTPSGQPEAVALNRVAFEDAGGELIDPCRDLLQAYVATATLFAERLGRRAPARIGIVYPTEMTEDLALIALLEATFRSRGHTVTLGSPYNLHATPSQGVGLFGNEVDLIIRHYKTDWWGEREPVWRDEAPFHDRAPLERPLGVLLAAELAGRVAIVNPFGSVLPQNKRTYAFLWERRSVFSAEARAIIEAHVPFSVRLETADLGELERRRDDWVLKSDYGCEGEEVLLGASLSAAEWRDALDLAVPGRWIAQRRFESTLDERSRIANHGVFIAAGRACGLYTRLSVGPTDAFALSAPTLIAA